MKKILFITTRHFTTGTSTGREKTLNFIFETFNKNFHVEKFYLPSILEFFTVSSAIRMAWVAIKLSVKREPIPLQSLIFLDEKVIQEISQIISLSKPDIVYFDGVRSGVYILLLRKALSGLRIICDFDDLMSARFQNAASGKAGLNFGYLSNKLPWIFRRLGSSKKIAAMVLRREAEKLKDLEIRLVYSSDAVVLVSKSEQRKLSENVGPARRVVCIPPAAELIRIYRPYSSLARFIFVGSDSIPQNRSTIQFLLELWRTQSPALRLHIYGKMKHQYVFVEGVVFEGFIEDLAEAYTPGSVLLCPSFIPGGVKTKVLEASGYGVLSLGNSLTFEGINVDCTLLSFDSEELSNLISQPKRIIEISSLAKSTIDEIVSVHSPTRVASDWTSLLPQMQ